MSDWLVEIQNSVSAYPAWLVITSAVIVVATLLLLLGKLFRAAAVVLLLGAIGFGGWVAWHHLFG